MRDCGTERLTQLTITDYIGGTRERERGSKGVREREEERKDNRESRGESERKREKGKQEGGGKGGRAKERNGGRE